jgi:hypothetical protein
LLHGSGSVQQAEDENGKHDEADHYVQPVSLKMKPDYRKGHTRDRCGNEQQQTELNQAFTVQVCGRMHDAWESGFICSCGSECSVAGKVGVALDEVECAACEDDSSRQQNACAEQIADDAFQTAVVHAG